MSDPETVCHPPAAPESTTLERISFTSSSGGATLEAPCYEVRESAIHGRGIFAARRIPEDVEIGRYRGVETDEDGTYVLWCYDENNELFGILGSNDLRFTNHSSEPNAIFLGDELISLRVIEPGEEITFDYGPEWAGQGEE